MQLQRQLHAHRSTNNPCGGFETLAAADTAIMFDNEALRTWLSQRGISCADLRGMSCREVSQ